MDALPFPAELQDEIASRLQDMVLETSDAEEFFQELAVFSASLLSPPRITRSLQCHRGAQEKARHGSVQQPPRPGNG